MREFVLANQKWKWLLGLLMLLLIQQQAIAQQQVTGRVTDGSTGESVPGVNIRIAGTSSGAVTDLEGNYRLEVPGNDAVLVFTFIGYESQEITVGNQTTLNVELASDINQLSEVVVTGYSTQRKKDITGAVAVVDVESLQAMPTGSAESALQGQASGVNVITPGSPGGKSKVFIRGVSSFGNTDPLVLVDGVQANLNDIRSEDIESIQVLKDAGAAAIYGVRGSNGVIVITTKKGRSGKPVVTYDSYVGAQLPLPGNPFNLLNSEDFARLSLVANPDNNLFKDGMPDYLYSGPGVSGTAMEGDPAVDPSLYNLDPLNPSNNYLIQKTNKEGTNWFQEVFDPALQMNHNVTASGGTDHSNYLFSVGYLNQQGTLNNTHLKRYSTRINTEFEPTENFRIGENAYIFYKDNIGFDNLSEFNPISDIYHAVPVVPAYDIMGNYGGTFAGPNLGLYSVPVASTGRTSNNRNNSWNILGNIYAEFDFLENFTARTSFGGSVDNNHSVYFNYNPYNDLQGSTSPNSMNENSQYNSKSIWTNTLTYGNEFGRHAIKAIIGTEAIRNYGRALGGSAANFFSTEFDYLVLNNGTSNITNYSSAYETSLFSLFTRLDYSFNDKYLLGVTVRRDGSSRFGPETRYGVFPSFSAGWRISEESFMDNITWVNDLKIRGSYGILGSEMNVDPANAFSVYGGGMRTSYYDIGGTSNSIQQGFILDRYGNPQTSWERNIMSNIGIDATLFDYTLDFSVEYYTKSIDGLLFPQPLPATAGNANPPIINIGDIENKGLDASFTYRNSINDFNYSVGANFTSYKNMVVSVPNPGYFETSSSRIGNLVRNQEGQPVSSFFGYDVVGLFQSEEDVESSPTQSGAAPGRFKYRDVNGDNEITADDRTFFGDPNPDFTYGLNLGLGYKAFDLSAMFYGSQGNENLNLVRYFTDFYSTFVGGKSNVLLDAWTPENTDTNIPKVESESSFSTSGVPNSYYLEDASFLRLRSLILGYTTNPEILESIGLSKLRVYVQGTNLFTATKYTGLDPELGGNSANFGVDYGNYPNNQRGFLFGVNVAF